MTLDDLQARCSDCPECEARWRWAGHPGPAGHKIAVYVDKQRYPVRRTVFELYKGRPVKKGYCIVSDCTDDKCMNPELLREVSKTQLINRMVKAGIIHHAAHKASLGLARRRRESKIGPERAREIYHAEGLQKDIAAKYGVTRQAVNYIKNQKNYRHIHDNNPFQGLMP